MEGQDAFIPVALPPGMASRYRLVRTLGSGGEAAVYAAERLADHQPVAIKIFRQGFTPKYVFPLGSPEHARAFPVAHTVEILERREELGQHYEIMEFCQHGTLADLIESNRWSLELTRQIVDQLQQALETMHPTVHGDLKPSNVLVRTLDPLDLVLSDFGLSQDLHGRTHITNTGKGSLAYLAPEAGIALRAESDWWALGMTVAEFAARKHPYQLASVALDGHERWLPETRIREELNTRPVPLDHVEDASLRLLLRGLLARDPQRRWGADEVARWLRGERPPVPDEGSTEGFRSGPARPLGFAGRLYHFPEALGDAMQTERQAAESLMKEPLSRHDLLEWLQKTPAHATVKRIVSATGLPASLQAALVASVLSTGHRPMYRGWNLGDHEALLRMVELGSGTRFLFEHRALHHFGTVLENEQLLALDHRWRTLSAESESLLKKYAGRPTAEQTNALRGMALAYAVDDAHRTSQLVESLASTDAERPELQQIPWYAQASENSSPAGVIARTCALPNAMAQWEEQLATQAATRRGKLADLEREADECAAKIRRLRNSDVHPWQPTRSLRAKAIWSLVVHTAALIATWAGGWWLGQAQFGPQQTDLLRAGLEEALRRTGIDDGSGRGLTTGDAPMLLAHMGLMSGHATVLAGTVVLHLLRHRVRTSPWGTALGWVLFVAISINPWRLLVGGWTPAAMIPLPLWGLAVLPLCGAALLPLWSRAARERRRAIRSMRQRITQIKREREELQAEGSA